jgi:hypothetical protein
MYIRNKASSITYKSLLVIIGLYALSLTLGIYNGTFNRSQLNYFTNLSNIWVVIYFIVDIVYISSRPSGTAWRPALKSAVTMAITVTFLVYHFLLTGEGFDMSGTMQTAMILTHYVVPIMTIADWFLFDKKGHMKAYSPLTWTILPSLYFVYAMIASQFGDGIGYKGSRYPYPFMDVDALGLPRVLMTVGVLLFFFIALGYIYYGIDRACYKYSNEGEKCEGDVV